MHIALHIETAGAIRQRHEDRQLLAFGRRRPAFRLQVEAAACKQGGLGRTEQAGAEQGQGATAQQPGDER